MSTSTNVSLLTNKEHIYALVATELEHTKSIIYFGNEKGRAKRTLKTVYQNTTEGVHLLVVLLRVCRRTAARM